MDKKTLNLEEVENFISENLYPIDDSNQKSRCVDGRYDGSSDLPVLARPGADAGLAMVAFGAINKLGLFLEDEKLFDLVIGLVGGHETFTYHTDSHGEKDGLGSGMGCGHLKLAKTYPLEYGLTPKQIEFIFSKLEEIKDFGGQTVLEGHHEERATVIVHSDHFSLLPKLELPNGELLQVFVYHQTLDKKSLTDLSQKLFNELSNLDPELTPEMVQEAVEFVADKQRAETLKHLTSHLPRYLATVDESGQAKVQVL